MKIVLWIAVIMFFGSIIFSVDSYHNIRVEKNGVIVKMRIEKIDGFCMGTRSNYYATFTYAGEMYIKKIPPGYCDDHHKGELVDMRYLEGYSIVLFPGESAVKEFYSSILIGLIAIIMFITQLKKRKSIEK